MPSDPAGSFPNPPGSPRLSSGRRPGVKSTGAHPLIRPLCLTVSRRTPAASAVEFEPRAATDRQSLPRDQIVKTVLEARESALAALTPDAPVTMPPVGAAGNTG